MEPPSAPRLIVTASWSFGRDRRLAFALEELVEAHGLAVADLWSDPDMNRTEICQIGAGRQQVAALLESGDLILPAIDLNRHVGTHPRVGALDQVRFEADEDPDSARVAALYFKVHFENRTQIPVLYDGPESEPGSESRILRIREAGFGGLGQFDPPDGDGLSPHPRWGVATVAAGPRRLSAWIDMADPSTTVADAVAERMGELRAQGDDLLLGVLAEGFALPTLEASRLGLVFEMPKRSDFDAICGLAGKEARLRGAAVTKSLARGAWRSEEMLRASRFVFGQRQHLGERRLDG